MKKQFLALALMTAAFTGCTDDSYDLDNISNDFRIGLNEYLPIASSEVKLKDILSEFKTDYISEESDGVLTFKFDTVNRVMVKPIEVSFKETAFEHDLVLEKLVAISNNAIPGDAKFFVEVPINLNIDDNDGSGKIKEIHIKEGLLKFHIETDAFDSEALTIKSVNIPYKELRPWDKNTGAIVLDMSDQVLSFPEDGYVVTCEIGMTNKYNGQPVALTSTDVKIKVVMEETKLTYRKIVGSFKSNVEQIEYTDFYLNLFDDHLPDFKLDVKDPKLKITGVTNSGIPLSCSVKRLVGKHKTNKESKKDSVEAIFFRGLSYESKSYDFDFKHSTVENQPTTAFVAEFDKTNGSLDTIFSYLPDSVSVRCGIKIDADPNSGNSYFLLDSTYVDLNIEANVPLHIGDASYITIKDTVDGIDIVKDVTDYQEGNFKFDDVEIFIEFDNALPLEGTVTAKFCKADSVNGKLVLTPLNNKKLDQTVNIPAAQVENGYVSKSTPSKKKIVVSDDMVEDIKKINAIDFTYKIKVPKGSVDGVFLTTACGMTAKVYSHLKANISNKEK